MKPIGSYFRYDLCKSGPYFYGSYKLDILELDELLNSLSP